MTVTYSRRPLHGVGQARVHDVFLRGAGDALLERLARRDRDLVAHLAELALQRLLHRLCKRTSTPSSVNQHKAAQAHRQAWSSTQLRRLNVALTCRVHMQEPTFHI